MEQYLTYNEDVFVLHNTIAQLQHEIDKPSKSKLNKCKKGIHEYTKRDNYWVCICGKVNNTLK